MRSSFFGSLAVLAHADDVDLSSLLQLKADGRDGTDLDCKHGAKRCQKTPGVCQDYTCPRGFTALASPPSSCGDKVCETSECCEQETTTTTTPPWNTKIVVKPNPTCKSYQCPAGSVKQRTFQRCDDKQCTDAECCRVTTTTTTTTNPKCTDYQCSTGWTKKSMKSMKSPDCSGGKCSDAKCCEEQPKCTDYTCSTGWTKKSMSYCSGGKCSDAKCCQEQPKCTDYKCSSGWEKKQRMPPYCSGDKCTDGMCCKEITTTTTTATTIGAMADCKLYGDPEINTFDGLTDKNVRGVSTSQLDIYKTGTYWIVNAPNVKIQGDFEFVGGLTKSSMTEFIMSGSALDGKVLKIVRGSSRDQSKAITWNGKFIRPTTRTPYRDSVLMISVAQHRSGLVYSFKSFKDDTFKFMWEPKFFSNVPQGMLDLTVWMNRRAGVSGLCGNMNQRLDDDTNFLTKRTSAVMASQSMFNGKVIPAQTVQQSACPPAKRSQAENWCRTKTRNTDHFNDCVFSYCQGGEEMAMADLDFLSDSAQVGAVQTGRRQVSASSPAWLRNLGRGFR